MIYRKAGKTDKQVSVIGLGCENLDNKPYEQIKSTIDAAMEHGINIFDIFMPGREIRENLANAIGSNRKNIMIQGHICSTNIKHQYDVSRDLPTAQRFFEEHLRLCGGYIDFGMLFFIDSDNDYLKIFESGIAEYMLKLKEKGDILHIGFSSHNPVTAMKAINTGIPEMMMFSINPAFDILPTGDSIFTHLENGFNEERFSGIEPKRAELYSLCERKNIAITVMKTLGAGKLISREHTPFFKPMTVAQCAHYALSRPAVASVLLGCKTPEEVHAAARYVELSDEERDFTDVLSTVRGGFQGSCVYCNHCQPCLGEIDIAAVNKYLDIANLDINNIPATIRSHYQSLAHKGNSCLGCGNCEKRCPFGVPVMNNMRKAEELLG